MFSSASWNDFITYGCEIIILYYAISTPWLYRQEIKRRLQNKSASSPAIESSHIENSMGPIQSEVSKHNFDSDESEEEEIPVFTATVTPLSPQENSINLNTHALNLISALMLEANTLASVIAGSSGTLEDINSMFRSMLERYIDLIDSPYLASINVFLLNACVKEGLPVNATQIESWWPQSSTQ